MSASEGTYPAPPRCPECGSENVAFKVMVMSNGSLFCRHTCLECGHNSNAIPKIENLQKRTNSSLANWRKNVLKRDGYRCVVCGSGINLHAHHIIPVSIDENCKYIEGNGVTLCEECHRLAHISKYDIKKIGGKNGQ